MPPAQCRTADTPSVRQRFQSSCCDHVDSFYVACSGEAVPSVIMRPKNSLTTVAAILNRGRQLQQQQRKLLASGGAYRHRGSHGTNTLVCSTVATYCEHSCDLQIVPFAGSTRTAGAVGDTRMVTSQSRLGFQFAAGGGLVLTTCLTAARVWGSGSGWLLS